MLVLPDGQVLAAGGCKYVDSTHPSSSSAELYDPNTGVWTLTGSMSVPRAEFKMVLLNDGTDLAAGGYYYFESGYYMMDPSSTKLYLPLPARSGCPLEACPITAMLSRWSCCLMATFLLLGSCLSWQ
jgi:hypothetical protein